MQQEGHNLRGPRSKVRITKRDILSCVKFVASCAEARH